MKMFHIKLTNIFKIASNKSLTLTRRNKLNNTNSSPIIYLNFRKYILNIHTEKQTITQ